MGVITGHLTELYQVASCWGLGVAVGIYATRSWCSSHMNPAVSLAMWVAGRLSLKQLGLYSVVQLAGAFIAASLVYVVFSKDIAYFETSNNILRGTPASARTAMVFGEFFPNPTNTSGLEVSHLKAFIIEVVSTFTLLSGVFLIGKKERPKSKFAPLVIGALVAVLIIIVAPYTQACFNPARDFGPRLFAMLAGWGRAAFPTIFLATFTVYIIAPLLGAGLAALVWKKYL